MYRFNLIAIFNKDKNSILMCKRRKDPYEGKINFIGGKVEKDETPLMGAYRELKEETNISSESIELKHIMDFKYYIEKFQLEIFYGILNSYDVDIYGDENELIWIDVNEDFNNLEKFAGIGNITHILNNIKLLESDNKYE